MKPAPDRKPPLTRLHWAVFGAVLIVVTAGIAFTIGTARAADHRMRAQLLAQTRLAQSAVNWRRIRNLTGTAADFVSTDYLRLKEQLTLMRVSQPALRFVYLMGQKPDGTVFLIADSESLDSPDAAPPGTLFEEAPDALRRVFVAKQSVVEGPVTDRWGTWISGFIPVLDPVTHECIAVFGMDMDARDWIWALAGHCIMPMALTFLIVTLLTAFLFLRRRAIHRKQREAASEKRYQMLFEGSSDAVMILDAGRFTDCNSATLTMFGYENRAEFIALHPADVSPPRQPGGVDSKTAADRHIHTALTKGIDRFEWMHRRRQGEDFPAEVWLTALHVDERQVLQATVRDITERKRSEELLRESEEQLRLALDAASAVAWVGQAEGDKVTEIGPVAKVFGKPAGFQHADRASFIQDIHPDDRTRVIASMQGAARTEAQTYSVDFRVPLADGGVRWLQATGRFEGDAAGHPAQIRGITRDITTAKKNEETISNLNTQLQVILDSSPAMIFYKDAENRFIRVNEAMAKANGLSKEEMEGQALWDLYPREIAERYWQDDRKVMASGVPLLNIVEEMITPHGSMWVQTDKIPYKNATGEVIGVIGFTLDITEQKRAEGELRSARTFLDSIINTIADPVFVKDDKRRFVLVNDAFCTIVNRPRDALLGKDDDDMFPMEEVAVFRKMDAAILDTGDVNLNEESLSNLSSGEVRTIVTRKTRYIDPAGRRFIVGVIRDITERKRIEMAVRKSEEQFRMLSEHSPIGISLVRPDMTYEYINPFFTQMFGYSIADTIDRNVWYEKAYPDPVYREHVKTAWKADVAERVGFRRMQAEIFTVRCKDGTDKMVRVNGVVLPDNRVLMTHEDITQLANTQKSLEAAKDAAEAATKTKSQFLANMSHEIRTPLNGIIGMTGLLINTKLTPEQQGYAEAVRSSGEILLSLITDILDFSKIEASKMELEKQPFNLTRCVEEALDLVAAKAAEKRIELCCYIEELPSDYIGDVTRLRQVLVNLLANAIKFTDHGEVLLSVSGQVRDAGQSQLHFSIRDTGIGISPEQQDRLFQSFKQVDASTTRKFGGTGLGLAISKQLAGLMGGTMWVESSGIPGQGATFHFTILVEKSPVSEAVQNAPRDLTSLAGKRILIVDDNPIGREILVRQMSAWTLQPTAVASGQEALERLQTGDPYHAAILDLQMPEMDGTMLAENIRRLPAGKNIPLILLSSIGYQAPAASHVNFSAFLTKPVKSSSLFDTLLSTVTQRSLPVRKPRDRLEHYDQYMGSRHPLRILVAEDNIVNQQVAVGMLGKIGYRADVVADGLEVLEALQRQPYDVILMDGQMPEMDGEQATVEIRKCWPKAEQPRIIAMTANVLKGERARYLALGMDDYMAKPIRIEDMERVLRQSKPLAPPHAIVLPAEAPRPDPDQPGELPKVPAMGKTLTALSPVFDWSELVARLVGDEALARKIIAAFLEDLPKQIHALQKHIDAGDPEAAGGQAHSIKGAAANVGGKALSAAAFAVEQAGRAGRLDTLAVLMPELNTQFIRLKEDLEKYLKHA